MAMARKLTKKEKGFVKDYEGKGTGSKTVKKHYEVTTDESARAIAYENLTKPHIQKALADRIPDDLLGERHIELLNKREVIRSLDGNVVLDLGPDTPAVSKGLDMAYKLKGLYKEHQDPVNILIPVLVKFLDKKDERTNNDRDTGRV